MDIQSYVFSNASRKHCEKFGDEMIVRIKTEEKIENRIKTSIFSSTAGRKDAQNYGLRKLLGVMEWRPGPVAHLPVQDLKLVETIIYLG